MSVTWWRKFANLDFRFHVENTREEDLTHPEDIAHFAKLHKLLSANQAIPILINHLYHSFNCLGLDVGGYRSCGLVFESVRCVDVVEVPGTAVVKVVQGEEGAGVEVRDVVLLCKVLVTAVL